MGLGSFKRRAEAKDGIWKSIDHGVRVKVKELGTPAYQSKLLELADINNVDEMDQATDFSTGEKVVRGQALLDNMLSQYLIAAIDDNGNIIDNQEEIHEIVIDPDMWEFRERVFELCRDRKNFTEKEQDAILGKQKDTPQQKSSGEENTRKKEKSGQT